MWLSKYEHQKPSEIALKTFETKTGRRLTTEESSTNQHDNIEPMQTPIYLHAAPRQFIHFKSNEVLELPFKPLDRLVDTTTASHTEQETKDELPSKRQLSEEGMEVDYYNFVFGYHENFLDKIDEIDTVYRKPWN